MLYAQDSQPGKRAKFEPPSGQTLLIIGQDLGAIGGFPKPNDDGYADHLPQKPGGVTTYLSLPLLRGMTERVNMFSGDLHAQGILDNPVYKNTVLAIGLHMVGEEKNIAEGTHDDRIKTLAQWIKKTQRPVFLRIGYEFDGTWNKYQPEPYKKAWRRIADQFRTEGVTNCAFVWQACASPYSGNKDKNLRDWYPGDDYVDWFGYSWFLSGSGQIKLTDKVLDLARECGKPVMVCESAPQGYDIARLTKGELSKGKNRKPKTPDEIWSEWFVPFFGYIDKHRDAIRVVAYINVNWDAQLMWGPPYMQGYWGDSRVQANPEIQKKWQETMSDKRWLHASPDLFAKLGLPASP